MSDEVFRIVVAGGVSLAALSFLILAVVAIVLASVVMKLKAKLDPILVSAAPIVSTVSQTTAELRPKIATISTQAVEVSKLVAAEAHRYSAVSKGIAEKAVDVSGLVQAEAHRYADLSKGVAEKAVGISELVITEAQRYAEISKDVAARTKTHVANADQAVNAAVSQVQSASSSVTSAVLRPFREIDGVLTGVSAAVSTFARGRKASVSNATQDEEMFI